MLGAFVLLHAAFTLHGTQATTMKQKANLFFSSSACGREPSSRHAYFQFGAEARDGAATRRMAAALLDEFERLSGSGSAEGNDKGRHPQGLSPYPLSPHGPK